MKVKSKNKTTINAMGKGARAVYLEKHPHGFAALNKVHKSKKSYDRNNTKPGYKVENN